MGITYKESAVFDSVVDDIFFYSLSTEKEFIFKAFLTDFNDQYTTNWNSQEIYGRMDPIYTYKNTVRKITLGFDVPSYDILESIINANRAETLINSLYPVYTSEGSGGTALISTPPLFKIKFANLIINASVEDAPAATSAKDAGLLGWIDGFAFKPETDSGFFIEEKSVRPPLDRSPTGRLFPKLFKVSFTFNVIHEHALGTLGGEKAPRVSITNMPSSFSHQFFTSINDSRFDSIRATNSRPRPRPRPANAVQEATSTENPTDD